MTDVELQRQKPETNDARADFQGGLEEWMRDHLNNCMPLSSCNSAYDHEDNDEEGDQLLHQGRCSVHGGDDLVESSATRRCHSRILSRWAAQQAKEMITTIERRNHESELMALAGLHTVSMLDSSFLRESQSSTSRWQGSVERPNTQASPLVQMWRELEDTHTVNRARERVRERLMNQSSVESSTNLSSINMSEGLGSEHRGSLEDESDSDYGTWSQGQMESQDERGDRHVSGREQSPDLGEVERERVRHIVQGWMDSGISNNTSNITQRNSTREEWLGETERERVRLVREWVQMSNQQIGAGESRREEQTTGLSVQVDSVRNGFVVDHDGGQPEHIRRDTLRLRGRQALLDLLVRIERERRRELQGLSEHRAVSDFAHRNRIQSLLRGRFLRNERSTEEERPPSTAASELGQLRQRHTVSDLREGFRTGLENIVHGQVTSHSDTSSNNNMSASRNGQMLTGNSHDPNENQEQPWPRSQESDVHLLAEPTGDLERRGSVVTTNSQETTIQGGDWQEQVTETERRDWQQSTEVEFNRWQDSNEEEMDGNWQVNTGIDWLQGTSGISEEDGHPQEVHEWHEDGSQESADNWPDGPSDPPRTQPTVPIRRVNPFHLPDDDNAFSMELRELLSRRSVSNLLHSGFRENLDQLIRSYVERQGHAPVNWDLHRTLSARVSPEQYQEQQRDDQNEDQPDTITGSPLVVPSPPVPPPPPLWHQELHHWPRHSMHRSEIEWEIINDLRADMASLQQGMRHMQRMLEACMDMQLELRRSVRQEVSAALNRSAGGPGLGVDLSEDGSKWGHVRNGTCWICCESHIDSLLYRCGHMCTCSKCGDELIQSGGKCPLCRAPIVEVIRAYSIL